MSLGTLEFWVIVPGALLTLWFAYQLCLSSFDPARRRRLILLCGLSLGLVFGGGGALSITRISRSARPQIAGILTKVRQYTGKSPETIFDLVDDNGRSFHLISAHTPQLQAGERVEVKYLDEYAWVLDLRIVSGPYSGYESHKSDDLNSARLSAMFGALIAIMGFIWWLVLGRQQLPLNDV